jgi:hypothetical protein
MQHPTRGSRRARVLVGGLVAAVLATIGAPAFAGRFAVDVGIGASHVRVIQAWDEDDSLERFGITPLAIGLGRTIGARWTVGVRTTGFWFPYQLRWRTVEKDVVRTHSGPRRWYFSQLVGAAAQVDLRDDLSAGLAVGPSFFAARPVSIYLDRGFGVAARLAWLFWRRGDQALAASWELQPAVFANNEVTLGSLLLVEWRRR